MAEEKERISNVGRRMCILPDESKTTKPINMVVDFKIFKVWDEGVRINATVLAHC